MPLSENPESISTFADLEQYIGRRVSVNVIHLGDLSDPHAKYVPDNRFLRIVGILNKSGKDYIIEPDGVDMNLSHVAPMISEWQGGFEARAPKLED